MHLIDTPPVSQAIYSLGKVTFIQHHADAVTFMVVLGFVKKMLANPGIWSIDSFFDYRNEVKLNLDNSIKEMLASSPLKSPPRYTRSSTLVGNFNPVEMARVPVPSGSYHTTQPTILSNQPTYQPPVPNTLPVHPSGNPGSPDDSDASSTSSSSTTPSMRANMEHLAELDWKEYQAQQAEERFTNYNQPPIDTNSISSSTSTRIKRSTKYKRYYAPPRIRSNVGSDKFTWDGKRSSYGAFSADLEGTMLRLGAGYLFDRMVMQSYEFEGIAYIKSDLFWMEHQISIPQFKYDVMYLYGLLQSATRKKTNPYIVHHRQDKDGLAAHTNT